MLRRWPFLIPFLFMTVGMTFSAFNGYYCDVVTVIAVFSCLVLSCFVRDSRLFSVCTALFFFLWGSYALHPWLAPEPSSLSTRAITADVPVTIEGVISARPQVAPDGSRLVVDVEHIFIDGRTGTVSGRLLLNIGDGDVTLSRGDRIRFISRLSVPRRLGLPGEFDYRRYLAFQEISAAGRVASQNDIVLIRAAAVESMLRTVDLAARRLGDAIRTSIADERVSSVLTALLIGDQRRIPRDLAEAYTRAGVNHILSISGFHVGIIAAFITVLVIWFLTRFEYPALYWNVRRIALLVAVPAMVAYLFLTGSAPATARSVIMLTVFAAALFAERERDSINTLLLAAFFLVAGNPPTLFDVSFQLSFISLWGILIAVPLIMRLTATVTSLWLRSLIQFTAASAAATCVTLLPVLFIFKVASLNGILTNFIVVPLLGYGAVLTGFIALPFVLLFPPVAPLLLWPSATLIALSNVFIIWCTSLPVISFYGITGWDMLFFLMLMFCMTFLRSRLLLAASGVLIPVTAFALHIHAANMTDGRLHITMLSVGQAESMLIRLPDGSTLLVDGGGYLHDTGHDFGQRVLAPALGVLHAGHINRVIATHDHPDHSGGLPFVIKNFTVDEFWSGPDVSTELRRELDMKQIPQRTLATGDVVTLPGPVVITVLSPSGSGRRAAGSDESSVNEQSLVFRLSYGSFSMIFCADAGFEAERRLISGGYELHSTVLKVGHHGSRFSTSKEFLKRVHPELAVISAGAGNRFGLPSPQTVELLESKKIPLYRTDRDGTIDIVTDGDGWTVSNAYKPE
ncbi:MAG: DNA internalization-related competence protein ComEC/Rec2 [Geobacteraceae bacterium GWC2_53_11]|nr:MAG: DNA internalization-related competence protein ComEC/Rec2 [Geobacteraceae bacterium GWC2_53_11]